MEPQSSSQVSYDSQDSDGEYLIELNITHQISSDGLSIREMKSTKMNGTIIEVSKDGTNIYEGEWKDNKKEGKGILKLIDGSSYEGEWKNDRIEGKGIMEYRDGGFYLFRYREGMIYGVGMLSMRDRYIFFGESDIFF